MKTHAIRIHAYGDADALSWEEVELADPAAGEARVRHAAVGVNYIDIYFRSGLYPVAQFPSGLGMEAAGVVEALGEGVTGLSVGQRVAYASPPLGAYAEARNIAADRLVALPDEVPDGQAAGMMLKGMTAEYLLRRTYSVSQGETILVHAAAGGVGLILCQWARHLGATVIGTVGSDDKAALACEHGCHFPVVYTREDFVERVKAITDGAGVPVVYDSVGKDTFERSLECLRRRGLLVSFGQSSGSVPAFQIGELSAKGSLFVTRPTLAHYTAETAELRASAGALFEVIGSGAVRVDARQSFALREAAAAHRALEGRQTTGSTILTP